MNFHAVIRGSYHMNIKKTPQRCDGSSECLFSGVQSVMFSVKGVGDFVRDSAVEVVTV